LTTEHGTMTELSGLHFYKLEALGNDFMLVDQRTQTATFSPGQIDQLGDRRTGVGFDQLLLLNHALDPTDSSAEPVALKLTIFNCDGTAAEQCGNGLRAIALWLDRRGQLETNHQLQTPAGISTLSRARHQRYTASLPGVKQIEQAELPALPDQALHADLILLGNPHLVIHWPEPASEATLIEVARFVQNQPGWHNRCNIGLACLQASDDPTGSGVVELRVFERGAAATRACGSGACAAAVSLLLRHSLNTPLQVIQPGGGVMVDWDVDQELVYLTGPARFLYEGRLA